MDTKRRLLQGVELSRRRVRSVFALLNNLHHMRMFVCGCVCVGGCSGCMREKERLYVLQVAGVRARWDWMWRERRIAVERGIYRLGLYALFALIEWYLVYELKFTVVESLSDMYMYSSNAFLREISARELARGRIVIPIRKFLTSMLKKRKEKRSTVT